MLGSLRKNEHDILHTARVKQYPNGGFEIMACSSPIFKDPGYEPVNDSAVLPSVKRINKNASADLERAARRAAAKIRDLALCNSFCWFVTLTISPDSVDRYDIKAITKKLNVFLDNRVRRDGLAYVLVPERHKDGAVHFHGFFNDVSGMVDSGTWSIPGVSSPVRPKSSAELSAWTAQGDSAGFHRVFNYTGWKYGFSTAIRLYGNYSSAVSYVCKYIRKQVSGGKIGGRWYYSGGELKLPEVSLWDVSFRELVDSSEKPYVFDVDEARLSFAVLRKNL